MKKTSRHQVHTHDTFLNDKIQVIKYVDIDMYEFLSEGIINWNVLSFYEAWLDAIGLIQSNGNVWEALSGVWHKKVSIHLKLPFISSRCSFSFQKLPLVVWYALSKNRSIWFSKILIFWNLSCLDPSLLLIHWAGSLFRNKDKILLKWAPHPCWVYQHEPTCETLSLLDIYHCNECTIV